MTKYRYATLRRLALLGFAVALCVGCSFLRGREDGEFVLEEKDPYPFEEPRIVRSR